jgi:lipoprotein-releasing system ATP-binding protein
LTVLEATDLSFGYRRDEPIIEGLSQRFESGSVTAVTGRSGSGKSTLLYLLGLLLTPDSGRVGVGEVADASGLGDRARSVLRAQRVGFVFQDAALDPARSVVDNVAEGALYAGVGRRQAIAAAHVLLERFEVGLRADHRPGEVSGGQAQRVALCRALINDPPVILADEPTGNLDPATAQVVIDALGDAAHHDGSTVVIASHDPHIAQACDRVLTL